MTSRDLKVKLVITIRLEPNISRIARDAIATIANYTRWSAIVATVWLLVFISSCPFHWFFLAHYSTVFTALDARTFVRNAGGSVYKKAVLSQR